jgi:hypothetical protein
MSNGNLAFDGKCAFAVSLGAGAKAPDADPKYTVTTNDTTYAFVGFVPKLLFRLIPGSAARADRAWATAKAGKPKA